MGRDGGQQPSLKLTPLPSAGGTSCECWQPWLSPKAEQVGNFQAWGERGSSHKGYTAKGLSCQHPPGPRFSVLIKSWLLPRSPSHDKIFSRLVAAAAEHPGSQGAAVIGCPGNRRKEDQAFRVPPPPTALSPPAGSTCNDREWPPGGQAGSATQGSRGRGFVAETLSWLWGRGRAGLGLVLTAPLSCNIESGGARIRCPVLQIRKLRLTEIV